ncbi:MAG: RNA polymerase sigma factor [Blastocatellia bacterium]
MNSEQELIQRARNGDQEAFCLLMRTYAPRVYRLALHYCQNPQDAEDLSQEAWLKAWRAIGGFRGEAGFYTWLRQITIHTFLNSQRSTGMFSGDKKAFRMGTLVSMDELEQQLGLTAPARQAETEMHQQILAGQVLRNIGELTPPQRLMFLLRHVEGMTYEEIARACGNSTGTVKKSLFRVIGKLRGALGLGGATPAADRRAELATVERTQ